MVKLGNLIAGSVFAASLALAGYANDMHKAQRPAQPRSVAMISGNQHEVKLERSVPARAIPAAAPFIAQADTTGMTAAARDSHTPPANSLARTLIDADGSDPTKSTHARVKRLAHGKSLDDCVTCPPKMQLQPGYTEYNRADGTVERFKDALTPQSKFEKTATEYCDRFADTHEICLFPGDSVKQTQPFSGAQLGAIKRGEATGDIRVSRSELRKLGYTNTEIKQIESKFYDGQTPREITRTELDELSSILRHSSDGKRVLILPTYSIFQPRGAEDCSYARVTVLKACDLPPPPVPAAPKPYCGDGILHPEMGEECEVGQAVPEGYDCIDCKLVPEAPKPYCGDGIIQFGEECEVGQEVPEGKECIDCKLQDVNIPPVVELPTSNLNFRIMQGPAGLENRMDFNKPLSGNCPTPDCTAAFGEQAYEGTTRTVEIGYAQRNAMVTLTGEQTELELKRLNVSHASFRPFFDVDQIESRKLTVEARGLKSIAGAGVYLGLQAGIGDVKVTDNDVSQTVDTSEMQGTVGLQVGGYDGSHGFIGAGYRVFGQSHLMTSPVFTPQLEAAAIKGPLAEAGGMVRLFNRADLFGRGTYLFNANADGQPIDNRIEWKAGANLWIDNKGIFQWGATAQYGHKDPLNLQFGGPSPYSQSITTQDNWQVGVVGKVQVGR